MSRKKPAGGSWPPRPAYYVYDTPAVRFIALDTNCLAGGASGCLDGKQARWLETKLAEVHSAYRGPAGSDVQTGHDDRLVIVFSHHGTDTLDNTRGGHAGPDGEPLLGADLVALLHRFPNVVLWLNGHTHTNTIRPRPDPALPAQASALSLARSACRSAALKPCSASHDATPP